MGSSEDSGWNEDPVKDASGKAITTTNKAARTADGKGEFVLNTPVYTQADIGKEYTYWVREIPGRRYRDILMIRLHIR